MSDERAFASWEAAVEWLLDQPDRQDLVRACYYDRPAIGAAERFRASGEWQAIREYLPPTPGRALDVGAGMGIAAFALAKDGWQVSALEPDPSALVGAEAVRRLCREGGLDVEVVQEWGESLPFPGQTFDLVHARQVLHHARDLPRLCAEIARVLVPGGRLVATREHVISSDEQRAPFLASHPLHGLYGGENAFMLGQYVDALRSAGLEVMVSLGPLESVINYAPFTQDTLCAEIRRRASRVPAGGLAADVLLAKPWRGAALRFLSRFDRRPGRLYTFVCRKGMGPDR